MVGAVRLRAKMCHLPDNLEDLKDTCTFTVAELLEHDPNEVVRQHEASEIETPDKNMCAVSQIGFQSQSYRKANKAPCIYVIGAIGLFNFTSHFSVMVELTNNENQLHEFILSEGYPSVKTIDSNFPAYYTFRIDDPEIEKLTI